MGTTLAPQTATGNDIPIEERPAEELCCLTVNGQKHRIPPEGIGVWNPAFDVTPASLITGLITEDGGIPRASGYAGFDVTAFVQEHEAEAAPPQKRQKTVA